MLLRRILLDFHVKEWTCTCVWNVYWKFAKSVHSVNIYKLDSILHTCTCSSGLCLYMLYIDIHKFYHASTCSQILLFCSGSWITWQRATGGHSKYSSSVPTRWLDRSVQSKPESTTITQCWLLFREYIYHYTYTYRE